MSRGHDEYVNQERKKGVLLQQVQRAQRQISELLEPKGSGENDLQKLTGMFNQLANESVISGPKEDAAQATESLNEALYQAHSNLNESFEKFVKEAKSWRNTWNASFKPSENKVKQGQMLEDMLETFRSDCQDAFDEYMPVITQGHSSEAEASSAFTSLYNSFVDGVNAFCEAIGIGTVLAHAEVAETTQEVTEKFKSEYEDNVAPKGPS